MTGGTPTRLDPPKDAGARTRLDVPATAANATRLDDAPAARTVFNLPAALAARWRIVAPIPASGAEAELFVVARLDDGAEAVAKIYRLGLRPRTEALERVEATVRDHVVRVLERGESDGLAYEVMEYCRHGSLRSLLPGCAGDAHRVEALLAELAPALAALHSAGLIHRDLKPENVLVRALDPLDLVLADFGIASVVDGTHHFTGASRTVRYAAPEAMTGVISAKADCWSLGMILLEALTGRHPFAGLSEAVVNHQLVTRPVDVSAVTDPAWRALLRGLLLRDPEHRWGDDEVARWLAHDPTFDRTRPPVDDGAQAPLARPYEIEGDRCFTAEELGAVLVRHWAHGVRDLARGFVTTWLRDELRDQNLVRFVHDLADETRLTPDMRLARFAWRVAPTLPATWKGASLADDRLAVAVERALGGDAAESEWLAEVYRSELAHVLPEGHPQRGTLVGRIEQVRARVATFEALQETLLDAEHAEHRAVSAESGFADMDELMFGREGGRLSRNAPPIAALFAADLAPEAIERMRRRVTATAFEIGADCGWYLSLGAPASLAPEAVALLDVVATRARAFAEKRRAARARAAQAALEESARLQRTLDTIVRECHAYAQDGPGDGTVRGLMRATTREFRSLHTTIHDAAHALPAFEDVRTKTRKAAPAIHAIAVALDRLDYLDRVRATVVGRAGPIAGAVVVVLLIFRAPILVFGTAAAVALGLGWYFTARSTAMQRISRAVSRLPAAVGPRPATEA